MPDPDAVTEAVKVGTPIGDVIPTVTGVESGSAGATMRVMTPAVVTVALRIVTGVQVGVTCGATTNCVVLENEPPHCCGTKSDPLREKMGMLFDDDGRNDRDDDGRDEPPIRTATPPPRT